MMPGRWRFPGLRLWGDEEATAARSAGDREPPRRASRSDELAELRARLERLEAASERGAVRVCSRCGYPMDPHGARLADAPPPRPTWALELTHGICPPCELAYDREIAVADDSRRVDDLIRSLQRRAAPGVAEPPEGDS